MKKLIRFLLLILNVLLIVSLLLSYLSCFISPETIWWLSFFGLAYGYLMIGNLFFVVFWLLSSSKRKYSLLSLVMILCGWGMIGRNIQLFSKSLPAGKTDQGIKVFSFNVHMFHQKDAKQEDGSKLNIFDFISESQSNIICMQEFMASKTGDLQTKIIGSRLNGTPHYYIESTIGPIGLATFSSYPIIHKELVFTDNTSNACILTDLVIGQDTVRVYNMHLKSIGFGKEQRELLNNALKKEYDDADVNTIKGMIRLMTKASFRRAQQVDFITKHVAQSPYPVIICGDFNDPPVSYSYQNIKGKRKDSFIESGSGRSPTYNIGKISAQRIDYILHSPYFKAYDYESPRVYLSDHYPVMCRLVPASR